MANRGRLLDRVASTMVAGAMLAVGVGTISPASAAMVCDNTVIHDTTVNDNVTVPAGTACEIVDATVTGNIVVGKNAILYFGPNAEAKGNVVGLEGSDLNFYDGAIVRGNIDARQPAPVDRAPFYLCDTFVGGFVRITGAPAVPVEFPITIGGPVCTVFEDQPTNTIVGSVFVLNNRVPVEIYNNTIGGALSCSGNVPPPSGGNNTARGGKTGQCAGL